MDLQATNTAAPLKETFDARQREPLAGAFLCVLAFFVVYMARPEDWIPGIGHLRPALIIGVFALVAFLMSVARMQEGLPREVVYLILLLVQLALSSVLSPVWKGGAISQTEEFAKMVLIVIVMTVAVTNLARLRKLIFVQTASVAIVALISIKTSHLIGQRMEGVLNGIYSNPNDLAIAIVVSLPFCLVFLLRARGALRKMIWTAGLLGMVLAVFRTASRGGMLALIVAAVLCVWDFGVKGRRLYLPALAVIVGVLFLFLAGKQVRERFADTFSSNSSNSPDSSNRDYEYANASAVARRQLLVRSLEVTAEHPLFGVGPGNFSIVSGAWRDTHNVYTALSSEDGIPALILFLMIYWRAFANLRRVRESETADSELGMFATALRAALWAFALAGPFYPDAYQYFVYFTLALTTIAAQVARTDGNAAGHAERTWEIKKRYEALPEAVAPAP